jgi:hypothetical protein
VSFEVEAASVRGEEAPAFAAAYAVMCVRISISFARVASSMLVLAAARLRFVPDVPVVPVLVVLPAAAVSLPARFVMILSIAATSVPQLFELAEAAAPDPFGAVRLDGRDADGFSSADR